MSTKFSQMPSAGSLSGSEIIPMVQDGGNVITSLDDVKDYVGAGGGDADYIPLTYGATTNWDLSTGRKRTLDLEGDTVLNVTGLTGVGWGIIKIVQDATGGRAVTFPGKVAEDFTLNPDANGISIVGFTNVDGVLCWDGATFAPDESLTLLENKVFEGFGDWSQNSASITSESGSVNKMKFNTASTFSGVYKGGIYADGDILRVTVNATITSGQCFMTFGDVNFNQVVTEVTNGTNVYDLINTGPGSGNTLMIGAGSPNASGVGYIRSIKIEKY